MSEVSNCVCWGFAEWEHPGDEADLENWLSVFPWRGTSSNGKKHLEGTEQRWKGMEEKLEAERGVSFENPDELTLATQSQTPMKYTVTS